MASDHAWADAQREFTQTYARCPEALPRERVELTWQTVRPVSGGAGLGAIPWLVWTLVRAVRGVDEGVRVSLRRVEHDGPGPGPLSFRVADGTFGDEANGHGPGVAVGQAEPDGHLAIETDHGVIWPAGPPRPG
jgi:hypothetical protein